MLDDYDGFKKLGRAAEVLNNWRHEISEGKACVVYGGKEYYSVGRSVKGMVDFMTVGNYPKQEGVYPETRRVFEAVIVLLKPYEEENYE